jgi:uncharacterized membrane protein
MENRSKTKTLVITSMMVAIIFIVTYLVSIPVPSMRAYINLGDSIIYCAGLLIGPWAAIAAAVGSALADWALGYPLFIPATFIIKGLMGLVCGLMMKNGKFPRFLITSVIAGLIMVIGYAAYEVIISGGWGYAVVTFIPNLIQLAGGVVGAAVLYYPVKRMKAAL